jgi:hypothetical protein
MDEIISVILLLFFWGGGHRLHARGCQIFEILVCLPIVYNKDAMYSYYNNSDKIHLI